MGMQEVHEPVFEAILESETCARCIIAAREPFVHGAPASTVNVKLVSVSFEWIGCGSASVGSYLRWGILVTVPFQVGQVRRYRLFSRLCQSSGIVELEDLQNAPRAARNLHSFVQWLVYFFSTAWFPSCVYADMCPDALREEEVALQLPHELHEVPCN